MTHGSKTVNGFTLYIRKTKHKTTAANVYENAFCFVCMTAPALISVGIFLVACHTQFYVFPSVLIEVCWQINVLLLLLPVTIRNRRSFVRSVAMRRHHRLIIIIIIISILSSMPPSSCRVGGFPPRRASENDRTAGTNCRGWEASTPAAGHRL